MKPLADLKVIELARILAGPWAGQLLADLGAEVTKIEHPNGDDTRQWGPPFITHEGETNAAYFHAANRGKNSVIIDFEHAEGQAEIYALIKTADIFIENFKVGGLAKYGLDYASLIKINPKLIYCSITGFGQTGPYASRAGYDFMIQGMGGIMDLTGESDGEPQKPGVAYADIFTGTYSVVGILAALRHRDKTGEGAHIDMALLDTQVSVLANQGMNYLASGITPKRMGNAHPNLVPYAVFKVSDGHIIIATGNDRQFASLCGVIGLPLRDMYANNALRIENRDALTSEIERETMRFTRDELLAALEKVFVPAGPINGVNDVFNDPQVIHRGMAQTLDGVPTLASPIVINGVRQVAGKPSPKLKF
jgi:crotonobetainyl-CoA:carnitine CoA-transferase CaiB-like acyl-CoA transferase